MVKASIIRKIRPAKSYTYAELARVVGKSEATVRNWARSGMTVLKAAKPHLILGSDARSYLTNRFHSKKPKLRIGEVRCFTCQTRRMLAWGMAQVLPNRPAGRRLVGLCEKCGGKCSRVIAERDIPLHA